jgi:amidase
VSTAAPFGTVDDACAAAATRAGEVLQSLGHRVETGAPQWMTMLAASGGPMSVPGPAALVPPERYDLVEPRNRPMLSRLAGMTIMEHSAWVGQVQSAARLFTAFWDDYDVLVTPTCGILPPSATYAPWDLPPEEHNKRLAAFAGFTQPFNVSGQPALSLPLAWTPDGLPVGVQLAGRYLEEGLLLRLAAQLEEAMPWSGRVPPQFA